MTLTRTTLVGLLLACGPVQYANGWEGVWLLRHAAGGKIFAGVHPLLEFQPLTKEKEIVALLATAKGVVPPMKSGKPAPGRTLRDGLVAHWTAEGTANDGAGQNHGTLKNGAGFAPGRTGQAFKLDGEDDYVDFGNAKALRITGSQTIAMWIRPDRLGSRQNPLAKDFGGEGTITLEASGHLNYYFGPVGNQRTPYCNLDTTGHGYLVHRRSIELKTWGTQARIKAGQWAHIAVVRNLDSGKLRWYVNGKKIIQCVSPFSVAKATKRPLYLGKGYVKNFAGLIDEVAIWNRALTDQEVNHVCKAGLSSPMRSSGTKILINGSFETGFFNPIFL